MPSAVGGVVGGLFGGSTPSAPNVSTWQPTGTTQFDQTFQNLLKSNIDNNPYQTYAPQAVSTFNQQYANPYASGYQTAANTAGANYGTQGTADTAASGALTTAGNTQLAAALQALGMGFDPRNTIHNQQSQQNTDITNANSAARGITNSPYGASVANTSSQNFESNWQDQQLQRALQALAGYNTGTAGANANFAGASTLGNAGAAEAAKAGAVPFAASTDITKSQNDAITQLLAILGNSGAGAYNTGNLDELMSYLNLGAGQANTQADLTLKNYANKLAASNASQAGLGSLVSSGLNLAGQTQTGSSIASLLAAL